MGFKNIEKNDPIVVVNTELAVCCLKYLIDGEGGFPLALKGDGHLTKKIIEVGQEGLD